MGCLSLLCAHNRAASSSSQLQRKRPGSTHCLSIKVKTRPLVAVGVLVWRPCVMDPVRDDQCHAADHHYESHDEEQSGLRRRRVWWDILSRSGQEHTCSFGQIMSYPDLLHWLHGLLLHQFDVEGRGKDEDQHSSGGRTCRETEKHLKNAPLKKIIITKIPKTDIIINKTINTLLNQIKYLKPIKK